jgi:plasmid stability protein
MNYAEMYAKTYSENGSAAIHRREQQWESQDVLRALKRESLRFYEQQAWDKLSEIDAERRRLAWKRQEQRWRDQDTIRLMQRLQKRKLDTQSWLRKPLGLRPSTESDISILCQA